MISRLVRTTVVDRVVLTPVVAVIRKTGVRPVMNTVTMRRRLNGTFP